MSERIPQNGLNADIRRLEEQIVQLKVSLEKFMAASMGRAEIEAEIISRVAQDTYQADKQATESRLTRLENGPQRLLGYISLGVAAVFGLGGCVGTAVAIIGTIFSIVWTLANH